MTRDQHRASLHIAAEHRRDDARRDADLTLSRALAAARAHFDAAVDAAFAGHRAATRAAGQAFNAEHADIEARFRVPVAERGAA